MVLTLEGLARKLFKSRVKNALRLARFPETPEVLRSYGTYGWYSSEKAGSELDYSVRPLNDVIRHTLGPRL